MAAKEIYDDTGVPEAVADVAQTLTLEGRGGAIAHIARKRVKIYKSRDGLTRTRVNFGGTNTEWIIVVPYNALIAGDEGTIWDFYITHGQGALYSFYFTHSDNHTYVVIILNDFQENWKGNLYSNGLQLAVLGKVLE